jgi:FeS assembly SUF system regulator
MLKLTKKADYGLIALKHLAEAARESSPALTQAFSAKDIADAYGLPPEALAKILQRLAKAGLLTSQHGINGGYALARGARTISAFDVIKAIDGPLFITACSTHSGECQQSTRCSVKEPLSKVNDGIREVLSKMTIADMLDPATADDDDFKPRVHESELVRLV